MPSTNNSQNTERQVIRLLYDLLLKWDNVLRYTDQIIQLIARNQSSHQKLRTFQSPSEQIRLSSNNQTLTESLHALQMGSLLSDQNDGMESSVKSDQKTRCKEVD